MAITVITPATSSAKPIVRHRVRLDGVDYLLDFDWSAREGAWYVTISDSSGNPIVGCAGRKICGNAPIGHRSNDARRPKGVLFATDSSGLGDPGIDDLGTRVLLTYFDASEVAA